jgi:hypothetical protein
MWRENPLLPLPLSSHIRERERAQFDCHCLIAITCVMAQYHTNY